MSNHCESQMQDQIEGAISENDRLRAEVEALRADRTNLLAALKLAEVLRSSRGELLEALRNARDIIATDRQAYVDCEALPDSRTENAVEHGLVWVEDDVWIEPNAADALRDYDRALSMIDAATAKAEGESNG